MSGSIKTRGCGRRCRGGIAGRRGKMKMRPVLILLERGARKHLGLDWLLPPHVDLHNQMHNRYLYDCRNICFAARARICSPRGDG